MTDLLTANDLDAFEDHPDFGGFGYIGGRRHLAESDRLSADDVVLAAANGAGWSCEDLFLWANSKPGRWFADDPFGIHAAGLLTLEGLR